MGFVDKATAYLKKGAKVSKEAFDKAGDKVQSFSDQTVIKLEIRKAQGTIEEVCAELGKIAETAFLDENKTELTAADEKVAPLLQKITDCRKKIADLQEDLKKFQVQE